MEKLPAQMTVIGISKPGGPEVLLPETRSLPTPGPGEILIKVAAAGVNRPDVAQRSGSYPPPPGASDLPGLEVAGEVVALGSGARRHKLGDKVMSLVAGGGYAQYCIARDAQAMAVPAARALRSFSIWSAATTSNAITMRRRSMAAWSRSPCLAVQRQTLTLPS